MVTIIILLILLILSLFIVPFGSNLVRDKIDLKETPIDKKFETLVSIINHALLGGQGKLTLFNNDPRAMNLMSDYQKNLLLQFYYGTGNLTIILNYKYFQRELVHKEVYTKVRNISIFEQKDIANAFLEVCERKILEHQKAVASEIAANHLQRNDRISENDGDPTQILSAVYKDLSLSQKHSIINLLYMIAKKNGTDDSEILNIAAISQQIIILDVVWEDCKTQFQQGGEPSVFEDLKDVNEGCMTLVIMSVISLLQELSYPYQEIGPDLEQYFFSIFDKLGYSEQRIEKIMIKVTSLFNLFNSCGD